MRTATLCRLLAAPPIAKAPPTNPTPHVQPAPIASIVAPMTVAAAKASGAGRRIASVPPHAAPASIPPAQHAVSTPKAVAPASNATVTRKTKATSAMAVA